MFGTFSESAMAAVGRAQDGAVRRGADQIDAGDVALAVLAQLDAGIDRGLTNLGHALEARPALVPADPLTTADRDQFGRLRRSAFTDRIPGQRIPFAESAIATFRGAWKKAKWDGRTSVDEYDLLTAAIEQPALAGARSASGIDLDLVRGIISGLHQPRPS